MKSVGLIGGIGPESTIDYYRSILALYRERHGDAPAPSIVINSIDVRKLLDFMGRGELQSVTEYLVVEIERLARSGVDFGAIAANTPHIVFDDVQRASRLPLVSIVDATCDAVAAASLQRVALFGTKYTMAGGFYMDGFTRRGMELVLPDEGEQDFIHAKYVGELLNNIFSDETGNALLAIVDALHRRSAIQGVILGGTELPLLLCQEEHDGVRFFDTTKIHVERIVTEIAS